MVLTLAQLCRQSLFKNLQAMISISPVVSFMNLSRSNLSIFFVKYWRTVYIQYLKLTCLFSESRGTFRRDCHHNCRRETAALRESLRTCRGNFFLSSISIVENLDKLSVSETLESLLLSYVHFWVTLPSTEALTGISVVFVNVGWLKNFEKQSVIFYSNSITSSVIHSKNTLTVKVTPRRKSKPQEILLITWFFGLEMELLKVEKMVLFCIFKISLRMTTAVTETILSIKWHVMNILSLSLYAHSLILKWTRFTLALLDSQYMAGLI